MDNLKYFKDRCRCEDNASLKERIYYVDNNPFFLHRYEIEQLQVPEITDREIKITANLENYSYL